MTSVCVALALKLSTRVPALLVVTVPMEVRPTSKLAPWANVENVPVVENTSCALAPPLRTRVRLAPL